MRTYETVIEVHEIFTIVNPTHEAAFILTHEDTIRNQVPAQKVKNLQRMYYGYIKDERFDKELQKRINYP